MNALKALLVVLFTVSSLAAQESDCSLAAQGGDSSKKVEYLSYEKVYLDNPTEKSDSIVKKFVASEYCLSTDTEREWKLLSYKQFIPLTIKIQTESFANKSYIGANLDADIKFSGGWRSVGSVSIGRCKINKWCYTEVSIDEEYNIYDEFDTLYFDGNLQKIDTAKISVLFEKVFPVKWTLNFDVDQPFNLSGSYYIKILGFCSEEQLKKIAENKKKRESKNKAVKKNKGK